VQNDSLARALVLLDGPMGTELCARGVRTPLPGWSAHALEEAPEIVCAIHRDYADAGAGVHTANTFRTQARLFPGRWAQLARRAVELARASVPPQARVAGSIAPLADCYRPDLSPARDDPGGTRREHAQLARVLADAGCDLILCETFPRVDEGLLALEAALETGRECWLSFTPGPRADLLRPAEVAAAARTAARLGAGAVLVNCVPTARAVEFVAPLADALAGSGATSGCYANAGEPEEHMGWTSAPLDAGLYADAAAGWRERGATILGGCCGTGPAHVRALATRFRARY
jgi:S-methylmethionine-dependent homocysteine/selenocysteine methylase